MTVICPDGHVSEGTDFCDECGVRIGAPEPAAAQACVVCAEPLAGAFCENCGHDRTRPPPEHRWTATVRADPVWFDEVCRTGRADARSLAFPLDRPDRRVELTGPVLAIGRCSGGHAPAIDVVPGPHPLERCGPLTSSGASPGQDRKWPGQSS